MRPDEKPSAAAFGKTRSLLGKLRLNPSQVNQAAGAAAGGRTRRDIAKQIAAVLATFGKGQG